MDFDFLKKENGKIVAVFDIASSSVGGLIFRKYKNKKPEILSSIRKSFKEGHVEQEIASVARILKKETKEKPDQILCVFSSPWYFSKVQVVKIKEEKNFTIDKKLIDDLIKEEMAVFSEEWRDKENIFLENFAIKTVLNGYATRDPLDKKTKSFDLSIYLSMAPKKIKKAIADCFGATEIHTHSFPFILWRVFLDVLNKNSEALFVDITGEITDLFIIRNKIIEEVSSFPKGENFLIKHLAENLKIELSEAKMLFAQYKRNELEEKTCLKIKNSLEAGAKEWFKYLNIFLEQAAEDKYLPHNLYFLGPSAKLKEIFSQFADKKFTDFTSMRQSFNINFLMPDSLKYYFEYKNNFAAAGDIFLLTSSLFANKIN